MRGNVLAVMRGVSGVGGARATDSAEFGAHDYEVTLRMKVDL